MHDQAKILRSFGRIVMLSILSTFLTCLSVVLVFAICGIGLATEPNKASYLPTIVASVEADGIIAKQKTSARTSL
jgi:hypothetical protein